MIITVFLLGFLGGFLVHWLMVHGRQGFALPLSEDEKYLLAAARAANGRLILKEDEGLTGRPILLLKEFPNPRHIEAHGVVEKMLARKLIQPDRSGVSGRYSLAPEGWARSEKLPPFPLQPNRPGAWFNSISRKPARLRRS